MKGSIAGAVRAFFLLSLLCVFFPPLTAALDPSHRISQYGHTAWRIQDGYFGGAPWRIAQTADGYIWIATQAGLFRFDGVRFVPFTSLSREQPYSADIKSVMAARDGSLWIGTAGGLSHWKDERLTQYPMAGGWVVTSIVEDSAGKIWIGRIRSGVDDSPLCQLIDPTFRCYGSRDGVPQIGTESLAADPSGNLWIGSATTLLKWRPGASTIYKPKILQSNEGINGVGTLSVAPDGSVWAGIDLAGRGAGLQRIVDGTLKPFVTPKFNGESIAVGSLFTDRENNLWVGTDDRGIYRIHGSDVDRYGSTDGLSGDHINDFLEDREGNLWVATSNGIDMFRDLRVSSLSAREGLSEDSVDSVLASRDGSIWIGTASHLEVLGQSGVSTQPGQALKGHQVTYLLEDHAGRLWAGMDNTLSVYEGVTGKGTFRKIRKKDGSEIGMVMGLTEDSEHNIWVQTHGPPAELIRIQDLQVQEEFPEPPIPIARKLVADPQGGIWLGLVGGDLARFRSGKIETITFANHPNTRVKALFAAPDGSILGGTEFGVVGWKNGKQQILTVRNGLPCNDINGLIADDQGNLWLFAQCGLIEIPKDEVRRWWEQPDSKLTLKSFDVLDGVQPGIGHFNTSAKTPDGILWFANGSVLQTIDPAHMAGNTLPPPVHITGIVADRESYSPQERLRLPPLTRDLEIDYTALSFAAPKKVLFRYMLEGHDTAWQEPGTRRQAFYNDLAPRRYRFRVIACNNDGVWNETGASLEFSIAPAYYQTSWFLTLCLVALLAILWGLYQLRVQQLQRQFDIGLQARVNERTRIARELHDTLLQSFQGAIFQIQAARNLLLRRADNAMEVLDEGILAAEGGITEGRAAIKDLRPDPVGQRSLTELLEAVGHELTENQELSGHSPSFRVIVEGKERYLSLMPQEEIYKISREAIRNAFLHAAASHIEVEIRYDEDQLRLRIRDDGKGIDPKNLNANGPPGHWGISGMRERAQRIGSRLDFWSEAGAGTEVQLTVPANAYDKAPRSSRFRLFRWGR
jgi:signal transduction histidine kinase/ligand-binding sensor domain-containing protein